MSSTLPVYLKGAPQRVLCYVTEVGGGTVILLITPRPIDVHCLNILKLWCPSWPLSIVKASKKLEDRTPYGILPVMQGRQGTGYLRTEQKLQFHQVYLSLS